MNMPKKSAVDVKEIRQRLRLSQPEFAERFGFSIGAVRHWEQGSRSPSGPTLILLSVISRSPDAVREAVAAA